MRILRPNEFEQLRDGAKSLEARTRLDGLITSALRYTEAVELQRHPDWFDGNQFIHIRETKKLRITRSHMKERWVRLSSRGSVVMPFFLKTRLPGRMSWIEDLNRWAVRGNLDPTGLGAKSLRKSYESWLTFAFPERAYRYNCHKDTLLW